MINKRREMLEPGYRTFTGVCLSEAQIKSLNEMNARINSFIDAGREPPEYLLNGVHHTFSCMALADTRQGAIRQ